MPYSTWWAPHRYNQNTVGGITMEQKIIIPEGYELQKINDSEYRIVKKDAELPNSWEEFCETHPMKEEEAWIDSYAEIKFVGNCKGANRTDKWFSNLPNKEYAEAILSFIQLIQLRDCYRQGWTPDWNINNMKYTVEQHYEDMVCSAASHVAQIFAFQSEEIRDKFYNNFKGLIEKTKPLFM